MRTILTAALVTLASQAVGQVINSEFIYELKKGHKIGCIPAIEKQFKALGVNANSAKIGLYCECMGTLLFNDMTKAQYNKLKENMVLPQEIESKRRGYQNFCYDTHLQ